MARRRLALAALVMLGLGCNRQDADTLGRLGAKVMTRAKSISPVKSSKDKLTVSLPGVANDSGPDAKGQ